MKDMSSVARFESIFANQLGGRELSSFSAADFRTAIAAQVSNDQMEIAEALGEAAISFTTLLGPAFHGLAGGVSFV